MIGGQSTWLMGGGATCCWNMGNGFSAPGVAGPPGAPPGSEMAKPIFGMPGGRITWGGVIVCVRGCQQHKSASSTAALYKCWRTYCRGSLAASFLASSFPEASCPGASLWEGDSHQLRELMTVLGKLTGEARRRHQSRRHQSRRHHSRRHHARRHHHSWRHHARHHAGKTLRWRVARHRWPCWSVYTGTRKRPDI